MMRRVMTAAALAGGLLLAPLMPGQSAQAAVAGLKAAGDAPSSITLVRHGGGHGGHGWGGGHGFVGARHMGHFGHHGHFHGFHHRGHFHRGHFHHHHFRHRHHHDFFFVGVPYYYDDYYYGYDCYWLKRRAIRTGSSYWWHRYYECRY